MDLRRLLDRTADLATTFLAGVGERPVGRPVAASTLRAALAGPLPDQGEDPLAVIEALARAADPGIVATAGPRYFGFVIGGEPARGARRRLAREPPGTRTRPLRHVAGGGGGRGGRGRVAARPARAARPGERRLHDRRDDGQLHGARGRAPRGARARRVGRRGARPRRRAGRHGGRLGDEAHATIFAALQMLGLGRGRVRRVAADDQGRMRRRRAPATLARSTARRSSARRRAT